MATTTNFRARRWTWTLNNYTEEEMVHLTSLNEDLDSHRIKYICYGKEVGSNGTPHLQGYIEFGILKSFTQTKSLISPRIHLEKSKGNSAQNREYCKKENTDFQEYGQQPPGQGKRTDIAIAKDAIDAGMSDLDLAHNHFTSWVKYHKAFKLYRDMVSVRTIEAPHALETFPQAWPRELSEKVTIFWGDSGIGKTCFAKALMKNPLMVSHIEDLRHFNPDVHGGLLFDDMDFKHIPREAQIHLVDSDDARTIHCRYECARIPAGTRKIFTTNLTGGEIFTIGDPAIKRRIKIRHLAML